ncbi:MAG: MoaD/ThiS family protein [Bryobacteraceae bacterium]|nr:MoaD/ThiS family protein [Bryobacteraceae bacterium]
MPSVYIPALLRSATGGQELVKVPGATVREVVASLEREFPALVGRLVKDGRLLPNLAIGIDGEVSFLGLAEDVGPEQEVQFLTAIKGGRSEALS